jgi:hypothetical protein
MQDAISIGGGTVFVTVTCNSPGAVLNAPNGQKIGNCPATVGIVFDPQSYAAWAQESMLDFQTEGDRYYLSGTVLAPGFESKSFRVQINRVVREKVYRTVNVELNPIYSQQSPAVITPSPQQQQQQQQTVIIPAMGGASETTQSGAITLSSTPENCDVYIDGAFAGNTPANLKLSVGIHIVEVKKTGYQQYRREMRVFANSETSLRVTLERE